MWDKIHNKNQLVSKISTVETPQKKKIYHHKYSNLNLKILKSDWSQANGYIQKVAGKMSASIRESTEIKRKVQTLFSFGCQQFPCTNSSKSYLSPMSTKYCHHNNYVDPPLMEIRLSIYSRSN